MVSTSSDLSIRRYRTNVQEQDRTSLRQHPGFPLHTTSIPTFLGVLRSVVQAALRFLRFTLPSPR